MSDFSSRNLSYLIQEGQGKNPEVRQALAKMLGPGVYLLAQDLLPEGPTHTRDALALTAAAFRTALAEPDQLQFFDSAQNWLYAAALGLARRDVRSAPILNHKTRARDRITLLLRYRHGLTLPQIAEITADDPEAVHRRLSRWRSRKVRKAPHPTQSHRGEELQQALDGMIPWHDPEIDEHLHTCPDCRQYLGELQSLEQALQAAFDDRAAKPFTEETLETILEALEKPSDQGPAWLSSVHTWELGWLSAAIIGFLLFALFLNPIWTPQPKPPTPTPTLPPPADLLSQFQGTDYAALSQAMQSSPLPLWHPLDPLSGDWLPDTPIAVSSNGHFASFGSGETLILWNLLENIQTPLGGHAANIRQVAFSPDGWLVSLDVDGVLRIWDVSMQAARYVIAEDKSLTGFALSSDGRTLVAAAKDSIPLWRFSGGELLRYNAIAPSGGATRLAVSPDGSQIAAGSPAGLITIWDLETREIELRFETIHKPVEHMRFSPTGGRLAVQSSQGIIEIFGLTRPLGAPMSATRIFTLDASSRSPDFAWLPDSRYIAAVLPGTQTPDSPGSAPPSIHFWEMTTGLPARLPLSLPGGEDYDSIQISENLDLAAGSTKGILQAFGPVAPDQRPPATEFNESLSDLFPAGIVYQESKDPFNLTFNLSMEAASERIALSIPIASVVPDGYSFQGAAYDEDTRIAAFAFTRSITPNRDEQILLRIRSRFSGRALNLQEDWIGAQVDLRHIQIGKFLGEFVRGEWIRSEIDRDSPGIFRWTDSPTTRFRWSQGDYLIELVSRSEIASEQIRWERLFQPLAMAVISTDAHIARIDYAIQDGDTCFDIAGKFGTTVDRLIELNNLDADCMIFSGGVLQVPVPPALGVFTQEDLNCDGSPERLRLIPDPLQPGTAVYFGIVLEALPEGGRAPEATFSEFDSITIANIDVTFFDLPSVIRLDGICGKFILLTGYGGSGEEAGLRIYTWTGSELRLMLKADGFLENDILEDLADDNTFTTQRLQYDDVEAACTLTRTSYTWASNGFVQTGRETIPGQQCFNPPDNE